MSVPCSPSYTSPRGGPESPSPSGSVPWGSGCLGHAGLNSQEALGTRGEEGALQSSEAPPHLKGTLSVQQVVQKKPTVAGGEETRGAFGRLALGVGGGKFQVELPQGGLGCFARSRGSGSGCPGVLPQLEGGQAGSSQALCMATAVPLSSAQSQLPRLCLVVETSQVLRGRLCKQHVAA